MIVTTRALYQIAYGDFALGAYNVNNMEQVLGLFEGHRRAEAPFIVQLSKGARRYAGAEMLEAIIRAAEARYPELVFAVHLDHGDEKTCYDAIASGFYSSVMIDASHEPFDENVAITRRVVERAHAAGVSVEAELGMLGGVEEDIAVEEEHAHLTDPDEARTFVEQTQCDSLAVAVGTSHGAYKFSGTQGLHLDRIRAIQERLPGFPLVLHGASSVPPDEVRRINAAGGALDAGARGVNISDVQKAIPLGVCKVNIDTDGRLVWTRVHREHFQNEPGAFDLRKPGAEFVEAFAEFVAERAREFGAAGMLERVRSALRPGSRTP
jgi:fructose-bisphosphate aldolase class II